MANLTTSRDPKWQEDKVAEFKATVGSGAKYLMGGAVVFLDATGLLSRAVTTAGAVTAGVVLREVDHTDTPAGEGYVRVQREGTFEFNYAPADADDAVVGDLVEWSDDNTVTDYTTGVLAGRIVSVVSTTKVRVQLAAKTIDTQGS